jgi:phosphoglucosamine mutase
MTSLPQVLVNVRVEKRGSLEAVPEVARMIAAAEEKLADTGRVLIRYSGTEPLLRIMLEGQDELQIAELAQDIASAIEKHMGGKKEGK